MIGRQATIVGVRSAGVVEAGDIRHQALLKLLNGLEAAAIQFFFFQILEKALHDSVVIGVTLSRKGLDHRQFINDLTEVPGSKLRALIRMEHDAFGNTPQPYSIPQGINCQEAVNFAADPASDDFSGVEVQDGTDVMEFTTNFYVSKITNPNHIWSFLVKSLRKKILTDAGILFTCRCFGLLNGAHFGQLHLFHQPVHPTFADGNAMLPRKTEGHLLYTQPFVGLGVDLQDSLSNL